MVTNEMTENKDVVKLVLNSHLSSKLWFCKCHAEILLKPSTKPIGRSTSKSVIFFKNLLFKNYTWPNVLNLIWRRDVEFDMASGVDVQIFSCARHGDWRPRGGGKRRLFILAMNTKNVFYQTTGPMRRNLIWSMRSISSIEILLVIWIRPF